MTSRFSKCQKSHKDQYHEHVIVWECRRDIWIDDFYRVNKNIPIPKYVLHNLVNKLTLQSGAVQFDLDRPHQAAPSNAIKHPNTTMTSIRRMLTGFLLAIAAGFGWGSMGVAAQVMMTDGGFTAQDLVALRVFGAGVLLTLMTLLTERGRVSKLFSDMVLLRDVVIYGLGVLATQFTFFLAIRDAGAATAAIMVITGPLFVIGWIAATTRKPVSILELAAFCLAATGVVLIITKGDLSVVNFSYSGVLWGLASAACGAFCTLQPGNAVKKLGVNAVVGFGMLFAGIGALFVYPPTEIDAVWTWETLAGYLYIIVVGTALAFVCYLKSLDYVPPAVTTILGASEPLTAVILSVVLLGTSFTPVESLGAVLIFATVFILAMREGRRRA